MEGKVARAMYSMTTLPVAESLLPAERKSLTVEGETLSQGVSTTDSGSVRLSAKTMGKDVPLEGKTGWLCLCCGGKEVVRFRL